MNIASTIKLPEWLLKPELEILFKSLGKGNAMLVGGCVRNSILQVDKTDIDIATILKPDEVIQKCSKAGFKTIPTGIEYGTVTIVIDKEVFEITTLRKDIKTDGRHADVEYSNNWLDDAKRRDFTMNALYMDLEGNVYDPLSEGIVDLEKRKVRFVGEPSKRIEEDYLRILRFFRFYAQYGEGEIDKAAIKACSQAAGKIKTLSLERITQEFLKILKTDKAAGVLEIMFQNGIMADVADKDYSPETLSILSSLQKQYEFENDMARLFVLGGNKPTLFEKYFRLSHVQMKFLIKLEMATHKKLYENAKTIKKAIFYHGNDLLIQGYLLRCAIEDKPVDNKLFEILKNWQSPECPITGDTLLAEGFQTGPELGIELNRRIEEWLDSLSFSENK